MSSLSVSSRSLKSRASVATVALSALALVAAAPAAHAQANLAFSGANGSALSFTLTAPVTYTVTTAITGSGNFPFFVFQQADTVNSFNSFASGSLTYSVNGGTAMTFNDLQSNFTAGAVTSGDLIAFNFSSSQPLAVGDKVTLTSGTLTTSSSISGVTPPSGAFNTFLAMNTSGTRVSSNGVSAAAAAPEPGSVALLALAGLPAVGAISVRRRRKAA